MALPDSGPTPLLELRSITRRYGEVLANDAVSVQVVPGSIHAVLGENGAGKSTLMKIINGEVRPDTGEMLWQGTPVVIDGPAAARQLGICMVHQHFALFESLTVAENIGLASLGRFDRARLSERIEELGRQHGLPVDPRRAVHHLSVGERQRVEILRCLLQDPKLLILDEPTAVLPPQAVTRLFKVLRTLAASGCSILYISHRLGEIRELCDRATVLRGGRVVATLDPAAATPDDLARLMVGHAVPPVARVGHECEVRPRLEVRQLSRLPEDPFGVTLREVDFEVRGGEIVGIAGVSGNGQAELLSALSGETASVREAVRLGGESAGHLDAGARRMRGLAFVPEERLGRGAMPQMSLADNALLTLHSQGLTRRGFIDRQRAMDCARRIIEQFSVRCAGPAAQAASLSGGNLQKFIMGRERSLRPSVLIVAQPTWGVDVAAAAELRQGLVDLSRQGTAVLVVSEDLDELLEICDRIAVIHDGRLSAARPRGAIDLGELGLAMTGMATAAPGCDPEAH